MNLSNVVDINVIAWEERARFNIWQGLCKTWIFIILKPLEFFAKVSSYKGRKYPLFFGMSVLGVSLAWYLIISLSFVVNTGIRKQELASAVFFIVLFFPVLYTVLSYSFSGLLHSAIGLLQGKRDFNRTFRIVNYSFAAGIFSLLPFVGVFIAIVCYFALVSMGIKNIHNLDLSKALISIICVCMLFSFAAVLLRFLWIS